MNHSDIELLLADYRGLRGSDRDEVEAHVATCASCAARLAEYREMDTTLQGLRDPRPDARLRTGFFAAIKGSDPAQSDRSGTQRQPVQRLAGFAMAATALMILAIIGIAWVSTRTGIEKAAQPAAVPPASTAITEIVFHCEGITEWPDPSSVISDFEAANPDVKVKFTPVHIFGTNEASYDAAVKHAAETADVYCAMPSPTHMQIGAARDLTPFIAADASFRPDDFYPGLLFRWGETTGPILAVPTYFRPNLIAYDPAAFDQAGLPYPQPGWTWDDFLTAAVQLTTRQGNEIVRWGYSEVGTGLINGRLWSEWSADWQVGPSYAALAATLAWYETLYVKTQAAPAPVTLGWEEGKTYTVTEDLNQYRNGNKSAMWDVTWAEAAQSEHLAPYPKSRTTEPHTLMSTLAGLVMSGQTTHPDASWRWISYLSQHMPEGEHLQARRSLAERASFWSKLDPASTAAYRYALDHLAAFPKSPSDYAAQMEAVVAVVKGEKTAAQALTDLAAQGQVRGAPGTPAPEQTVIITMATATPQPAAATPPAGATVITFACYRDRLPAYAPAVEAFQAANPGVYVELKALEDLGLTKEAASLQPGAFEAAAAQVDTLCDDTLPGKIRAGAAEQALRDLSPFIAADAAFDAADFYPGALEMLQAGAATWGIPRGLRLQLIYYSQYAFDQAGISYPTAGWTWDDFLRAATALTPAQGDGSLRWGFRENWPAQFGLLRAYGLPRLEDGMDGLMTPETQAALQWYVDLVRTHQVMPAPARYADSAPGGGSGGAANPWTDTAMFSGLANGLVADSRSLGSNIGVAPFPLGTTPRTTPLEQIDDAIAMSAATQHPAESWRWLAIASRAASDYERMVPARRSRFEASASLTGIDPAVQSIYRYALEHLTPPLDADSAVAQALSEAVRAAMVDGTPVDEALREAVKQ